MSPWNELETSDFAARHSTNSTTGWVEQLALMHTQQQFFLKLFYHLSFTVEPEKFQRQLMRWFPAKNSPLLSIFFGYICTHLCE